MQPDRCEPTVTGISKVSSLAALLSCSEEDLRDIASRVPQLHKTGAMQWKKDGTPRPTHDAHPALKDIHEKIKNRLLRKVRFPRYLLGGIADCDYPRTPEAHAQIHAASKIIISEDIEDFYPSTSRELVFKVWKYLFQFSPEVAELLTTLTTYDDSLPQGWKTSGYLANLAFWEREPDLVEWLAGMDCAYSRFADDVDVSSNNRLDNGTKTIVISELYRMLRSCGYNPKRRKHRIMTSGSQMEVTGINVNRKRLTLPKSYRKAVRAKVFQLEQRSPHERNTKAFCKDWRSAVGQVNHVRRFHPRMGQQLLLRLAPIKPPKHLLAVKRKKHAYTKQIPGSSSSLAQSIPLSFPKDDFSVSQIKTTS